MATKLKGQRVVGQVPDVDHAAIRQGELLSVRAEGHAHDAAGPAGDVAVVLARGRVSQPDVADAVIVVEAAAAAGDRLAVGAVGQAEDVDVVLLGPPAASRRSRRREQVKVPLSRHRWFRRRRRRSCRRG